MGIATSVVGVVVERAEVASGGRRELGKGRSGFRVLALVEQNLTFPVKRLGVQLWVHVGSPRALEELQRAGELFVLEQLDGTVEGEHLGGGLHGLVGVFNVAECFECPLVIP